MTTSPAKEQFRKHMDNRNMESVTSITKQTNTNYHEKNKTRISKGREA